MRLPNSYGSISKLSGNRRRKYMVRITVGFDSDGKQIFKILGYVKSRKEGLSLLADYHKNPNSIGNDTTFAELYEMFMDKKEDKLSDSSVRSYRAAFKASTPIHKMKMVDIRPHHMQPILDGKNSRSAKAMVKNMFIQVFTLGEQNDIVKKNYAKFLDVGKTEASKKQTFTEDEIKLLWKHQGDLYVDATLVLLYTGMRISELVEIKMENVHLDEQYMIGGLKTDAGKDRIIALADKIMPIMRRLYGDGSNPSLLMNDLKGVPHTYKTFVYKWRLVMDELGIERNLHEARHSAISRLYKTDARPEIIKKLVGHSSNSVTESVYLHVDVQQLLEVVNKLD